MSDRLSARARVLNVGWTRHVARVYGHEPAFCSPRLAPGLDDEAPPALSAGGACLFPVLRGSEAAYVYLQILPLHVLPPVQTVPHPPQLALSLLMSMHTPLPPQSGRFVGHVHALSVQVAPA